MSLEEQGQGNCHPLNFALLFSTHAFGQLPVDLSLRAEGQDKSQV